MYYIGQKGKSIQKGLEYYFKIANMREIGKNLVLYIKITSGERKNKYSRLMKSEIDNTLVFNK